MQKSKKATIAIIFLVLIYGLLAYFKISKLLGRIFTYILNPLFWIGTAILLRITLGKNKENKRLSKPIIQYTIIAILIFILTYMISGLFVSFGINAYKTTIDGLITNLWISGSILIAKEFIRYELINNVYDKEKKRIAILITIVFIVIEIEYERFIGRNNSIIIADYIFQGVLPLCARNMLCSYIAIYGNYIPSMMYVFFTKLYYWVSPILPDTPWIVNSVVETLIPIILLLYIRYEKNKYDKFRTKEKIINSDPRGLIPLVIGVILVIWFAMGVFPIKPVSIASGSMEKELMVGDVVIIKKCNSNDVTVGDIIEYQMSGYTVVHRIVKKEQRNGNFYFTTKGDNNNCEDSEEVLEDQLIGKVIFKIRYIGYPAIWLHKLQVDQESVNVETGN